MTFSLSLTLKDSDIAMVMPSDPALFVDRFSSVIRNISDCDTRYHPKRGLVQTVRGSAHGDVWFFEERTVSARMDDGAIRKHKILFNDDYTMPGPSVEYDVFFPSKKVQWNGLRVPIPNRPEKASSIVYGDDYMTPKFARMQCLENIATNKISRFRWTVYALTLLMVNWMALSLRKMTNNKMYCGFLRRNVISTIIAVVPTAIIDSTMKNLNGTPKHSDPSHQETEGLLASDAADDGQDDGDQNEEK